MRCDSGVGMHGPVEQRVVARGAHVFSRMSIAATLPCARECGAGGPGVVGAARVREMIFPGKSDRGWSGSGTDTPGRVEESGKCRYHLWYTKNQMRCRETGSCYLFWGICVSSTGSNVTSRLSPGRRRGSRVCWQLGDRDRRRPWRGAAWHHNINNHIDLCFGARRHPSTRAL